MTADRIQDLPSSERPRERLQSEGVTSLTNAELLALIIRTGTETKNVKKVCHRLLSTLGPEKTFNSSIEELKQFEGIGDVKAGQIQAVKELATRIDSEDVEKIASVEEAKSLFVPQLRNLEQEELHAALLGSSNRVKRTECIFRGSLRSMSVEPREIVRKALKHNASAVVLAHNHPDGTSEPTEADTSTTQKIDHALSQFEIHLLDHLIVGERDCFSLKQEGLL